MCCILKQSTMSIIGFENSEYKRREILNMASIKCPECGTEISDDVGTSVISEFYTPLVPKGYDFLGTIGELTHIRQDGQVACEAKATGTD